MIDKNILFSFLDEYYPDAKCSLNYCNDYELLIAIMLSAQTTDNAVNKVTAILFSTYPMLDDLNNADIKEIEKIISSIGLAKTKSKNIKEIAKILVTEYGGQVPLDENSLLSLPGIGNKTKNCFLAVWAHKPYLAVDTHVNRIAKRLNIAHIDDDVLDVEKKLIKFIPKERLIKTNHQLIEFGRTICSARFPKCEICPLSKNCKYFNHLPK